MRCTELACEVCLEDVLLGERDERIASELRRTISFFREMAREREEEARVLRAHANRIEAAVRAERWWELEGTIESRDIESLCEVSPINLLGEE